ncbi:MAG: DUF305 domain-containing protein [Lachnospiraceae bacterium]|nr:DUF305 domain-containing protein [Lachnospiraceae bacterium]
MDNKKTLYWAIGIVVALLVIFMFWGANRDKSGSSQDSTSAGQTESGMSSAGSEAHTGTDHENAKETAAGSTGAGDTADNTDTGYARYMEEETAIMDRMMRDMDLPEESGNAALDFIDGMIPHHEAAVSMAESYLNNGGNHAKLKPLAEDIIKAQKSELSQMKDMRKVIADSGKKVQEQADAYRAEYAKMMAKHHDGHGVGHSSNTGTGNGTGTDSDSIDAAFAAGMIMHHQMAVDMAKAILSNTDETDVLVLAQQIIDAQEEEITLMEKVLEES